jgi:hypothetical protein
MTRTRYVLCTALLSLLVPDMLTAQGSTCRPPDAISADLVADVVRMATGTDGLNAQLRQNRAIPQVSANKVTYVTDNAVCTKVLPVYNANTRTFDANTGAEVSTPTGQLYVVKVGTVYVAWDPGATAGEYRRLITLDSKYRILANSMQ